MAKGDGAPVLTCQTLQVGPFASLWATLLLHSAPSLRSAGAGRTGTFIALSNILERVKAEGLLDVFQAVKSLRLQRPHMVQTLVRNPTIRKLSKG